ncbi:unnamed protein product [Vicia faba]|uniref:Uncharacterized protein n=1 Tax=Vicia faba TaxID=3906 RepID=A0AAV0YIF7_VICFA|nr:unnamed protein product [Vicia faba]
MVRNVNGEVVQQTFLCHMEDARDDIYNNYAVRKREHKPTSRCGCLARIQVHLGFNTKRWCDTVGRTDCFWNAGLRFAFVFAKCRGKQESPPTFILSNKERKKAQKNSFFEISLGLGG